MRYPGLLLAAAVITVLTGAPAAAAAPAPGPAGAPVGDLESLALTSLACVSGGPTTGDADIANAVRPDMTGRRLGSAVNSYNVSCARAITKAVRAAGLNERAAVIAVTTAITETTLHNYDGGDRDSVGLFQQRPSQGWGDPDDLVKPAYATNAFLDALQRKYPGDSWMTGAIGPICQKVQVSATPDAYGYEVHDAGLLVDRLWAQDTATPPRIAVLTTTGTALVKEGSLSTTWTTENTGIQRVVVAGDRIGVLTTAGVALVKEGGLSAEWVTEYTGVKQIALSGDRIGVLTDAGVALVKEGGLSATWTTQYSGVQQLVLAGDRIGVLTTAGAALVKDGNLNAKWVTEYSGVTQLDLSADRIAVLTTAGVALVKEGGHGRSGPGQGRQPQRGLGDAVPRGAADRPGQ